MLNFVWLNFAVFGFIYVLTQEPLSCEFTGDFRGDPEEIINVASVVAVERGNANAAGQTEGFNDTLRIETGV